MTASKRNSHGVLRTENFKRPDHSDFKDSAELKASRFSGVRQNSLSQQWEIWTLGDLRASGQLQNQKAFMKSYAEIFALDNVLFIEAVYEEVSKPYNHNH